MSFTARRPLKKTDKGNAGRRWAYSLTASLLTHALAFSAVPGLMAVNEILNLPAEHFVYVDISREPRSAQEADEARPAGKAGAAARAAKVVPPTPTQFAKETDASGQAEPAAQADVTASAPDKVSLNSLDKADVPVAAATPGAPQEGVFMASAAPESAVKKSAPALAAFAGSRPHGELFEEISAVFPERGPAAAPAAKKVFVPYTGGDGMPARSLPGELKISGIQQKNSSSRRTAAVLSSAEKAGDTPSAKAPAAQVLAEAVNNTRRALPAPPPAKDRLASLAPESENGAVSEEMRPVEREKTFSARKALLARVMEGPLMQGARMVAPAESKAEIKIISPMNKAVYDGMSSPQIIISGTVRGNVDKVRICLNGRMYEVGPSGGIFNLKVPPEAEENLVFAEAVEGGSVRCRTDNVYFKVLNANPGDLTVFVNYKGKNESVKFRCSWKPHPLAKPGGNGQAPEYVEKNTPLGDSISVINAVPGIYTVGLDYDGPSACDAALNVYLYTKDPARKKFKRIGPFRLAGKGYVPAVRVLLPEGVFWEDDPWFSGMFEYSHETIKFRQPEGIVWKEEN